MRLDYRLYGVIQDVIFTHQPHFSCSFLSLICLSTNQNIQLIHSLLIRIEWTTGNKWVFSWSFSAEKIRVYEVRQMSILCVVLIGVK